MNFSEVDAYKAAHATRYLRRILDRRQRELAAYLRRLRHRNATHGTLASRLEEESVKDEMLTIDWARAILSPTKPASPSASAAASARWLAAGRAAPRR